MPSNVVLDTNIVLDLFVFNDPATAPLLTVLDAGELNWLTTLPMRDELARVLNYAHLVPKLAFYGLTADAVLARFDRSTRTVPVAPRATAVCKDADDQKFIDLAVAHQAKLLSKDNAVLRLRKRLMLLGVTVASDWQNSPLNEPIAPVFVQ